MFTSPLSWARPIQSTMPHPITLRSTLILPTNPCLHLLMIFPFWIPTNSSLGLGETESTWYVSHYLAYYISLGW
jgi:hypothetical protein